MSAKFTSPFPPLELSYHDERELEGVASRIVDEHAQLFNAYLHQDRGLINPSRWKRLRQRENVHVYQERRSFSRATSDGASELPILLAVGTIVGSLDDVMYGVLNPTLASMRLKTSYVEDDLVGAAVLATVTEPSRSEPFHSLTVKWAVKGRGACVRTLVKDRDFVYLESTGIGQLDNGERLGYQLLHSVSFSEVHELSDTLRGNMSICCVYRQKTHDTVELFMRGYLDPAGAVMRAMVVKSAADVMVSVCNNVYCSEMKKLAWTLQRQKEKTQSVRSRCPSLSLYNRQFRPSSIMERGERGRHEAGGYRRYTHPSRESDGDSEAPPEERPGLMARLYGRERLVFSSQDLCDDLLRSIPKLHAALESHPATNQQLWKRTFSGSSTVETFELVGTPPDAETNRNAVQYAVAASTTLQCHLNEVLNVLISANSADYTATMQTLNGRRFDGGDVLYHERCRLLAADETVEEEQQHGESQALLGVQMATLRPSWRLHLLPDRLCRPERRGIQSLCFATFTHRYPDSNRAVHVMKTLPKRIHDQIVPRAFHSALRRDVDHLGIGFDIEAVPADPEATGAAAQRQVTRVFVHGYAASPGSDAFDRHFPTLESGNGRPRGRTAPEDWQRISPRVVNPEARHVLELLTHQLCQFERVIGRRRFGFQSFIYFPPSSSSQNDGKTSGPSLRSACLICLKRFTLFRREFFCQLCGHLVCSECSQLYEVEARVGDVRKNRVCLRCVVRVDSCLFAEEDLVAALGPTVVPVRGSSEWSRVFQSDELDGYEDDDDAETASLSSDASSRTESDRDGGLAGQLYSQDPTDRSVGLAQLGQLLVNAKSKMEGYRAGARPRSRTRTKSRSRSRAGTGSNSNPKSSENGPEVKTLKERVERQVESHLNRSLRDAQPQFPLCNLETADLVRDYRYTFDTSKTTYKDHPLPPTPSPAREARRLHHIHASGILEPEFDHSALDLLAQVAAKRMGCPIGFVSLVDDKLFHSVGTYPPRNFGLQTPRAESMCSHTVYVDKPLVIKNAQTDMRFAQMPVVRDHGIRFYAGFPVRAPDGSIVASLCATDRVPHNNISAVDYAVMQTLASVAAELVAPSKRVVSIPQQPRVRAGSSARSQLRTPSRSQSRSRTQSTRKDRESKVTTISKYRQTGVEEKAESKRETARGYR
ncbi:hypothetical protein BBJ28_00010725 [Nothophytophthora sp. Chile5]|nr:hypothetical protein BBJ28_00010725 [Nothophytophthora sp. Chile5]